MASVSVLNNYIAVRISKPTEVVTGRHNLLIPRVATGLFETTGTIESIGSHVRIPELKVGMTILFPPYGAGKRVTLFGEPWIFILDWEALGFWDPEIV